MLSTPLSGGTPPTHPRAEIHLCGLERTDPQLAEMTFFALYEVELGEDGVPVRIERVKDIPQIAAVAAACVKTWRLEGFRSGFKTFAKLSWDHGLLREAKLGDAGTVFRVVVDRP